MKLSKELLATLGVLCMTSVAFAGEATDVQAYAHPTLFGSQGHSLVTTNSDVIVGGKVLKAVDAKTIEGKQNVVVSRYAKTLLNNMQETMSTMKTASADIKSPILRSELAYMISEGLGLTVSNSNKYTDIPAEYWAKTQIDRALSADVMIGYPDSTFKPDQTVTKAEVFATFAKMMEIPTDRTATPMFDGRKVQYIPNWAIGCSDEVIASGILNAIPDKDKLVENEYLSKEQVAYMISSLKTLFSIDTSNGSVINCASKYQPVAVQVKLSERLSARTSNVNDTFTAKTVDAVVLGGHTFPAGSTVKGVVSGVSRPGVKNPGYIEVQFDSIKDGKTCYEFPKQVQNAKVDVAKNPNIVSRILGAPFSIAGRTAGVAGRAVSETAEIVANGTEEYGDNWSDAFVDTASLHPLKGLKSVGSSFITAGKGVYNIAKYAVSGTFGVCYEIVDEFKYIIVPNTTNDSSLNPDEVLTILF